MKRILKNITFHRGLVIFGLIFWIGETWYFGWNETAQSSAERIADTIAWVAIIWGIIGDIVSGITVKKDTIVNAERVEVKR